MESIKSVQVAHERAIEKVADFLQLCARNKKPLGLAVVDHFTIGHMAAALWLQENHDMSLSVDNLYSLVEFWPTAMALAPGTKIPASCTTLCPRKFNPAHLVEYFEHEEPFAM